MTNQFSKLNKHCALGYGEDFSCFFLETCAIIPIAGRKSSNEVSRNIFAVTSSKKNLETPSAKIETFSFCAFFWLKFSMKTEKLERKQNFIEVFDKSKTVAEACRITGTAPSTFYFFLKADDDFRRQVLEKRREHLSEQIAETV